MKITKRLLAFLLFFAFYAGTQASSASVIFYRMNNATPEILLAEPADLYYPYSDLGGAVDKGESLVEGAAREAVEEGLFLKISAFNTIVEIINDSKDNKESRIRESILKSQNYRDIEKSISNGWHLKKPNGHNQYFAMWPFDFDPTEEYGAKRGLISSGYEKSNYQNFDLYFPFLEYSSLKWFDLKKLMNLLVERRTAEKFDGKLISLKRGWTTLAQFQDKIADQFKIGTPLSSIEKKKLLSDIENKVKGGKKQEVSSEQKKESSSWVRPAQVISIAVAMYGTYKVINSVYLQKMTKKLEDGLYPTDWLTKRELVQYNKRKFDKVARSIYARTPFWRRAYALLPRVIKNKLLWSRG